MNNSLKILDSNELLKCYDDIYMEYMKALLVYEEVRDILYEYDIKSFYYDKLNYLEEKFISIKNMLISDGITIPCDKDVFYTADDIIRVISYICNKEIEWIKENSFIYDNEIDTDYFGIDIDYCFDDYDDECVSDLIIKERIKLYDKIIDDTREKYQDKKFIKKKVLE
ncbi:MAG: hypothetical protein IJZ79_06880 [Bacilli bacterium]|nr:hypothetical protein [Bacilli bacterium]